MWSKYTHAHYCPPFEKSIYTFIIVPVTYIIHISLKRTGLYNHLSAENALCIFEYKKKQVFHLHISSFLILQGFCVIIY